MTSTTQTLSGSNQKPTLLFPIKGDAQFDLFENKLKDLSASIIKVLPEEVKEYYRENFHHSDVFEVFHMTLIKALGSFTNDPRLATEDCKEFINELCDDLAFDMCDEIGMKREPISKEFLMDIKDIGLRHALIKKFAEN